jgi:cell division protein FtsB
MRPSPVLRFLGRIAATGVALMVFGLVAIQMGRVVEQNLALTRELSATQTDIGHLEARRAWQIQQLRRLEDPEGAVPEIHDRLHLVRSNEAIIFIKPMPSPLPSTTP